MNQHYIRHEISVNTHHIRHEISVNIYHIRHEISVNQHYIRNEIRRLIRTPKNAYKPSKGFQAGSLFEIVKAYKLLSTFL